MYVFVFPALPGFCAAGVLLLLLLEFSYIKFFRLQRPRPATSSGRATADNPQATSQLPQVQALPALEELSDSVVRNRNHQDRAGVGWTGASSDSHVTIANTPAPKKTPHPTVLPTASPTALVTANPTAGSTKKLAIDRAVPAYVAVQLSNFAHVTHTHSSSADSWPLAFDTLQRYGRDAANRSGVRVRFVVCVDREHPMLAKWPWLEVVTYTKTQYPAKVAECLRKLDTKYVLHAMEDMVLTAVAEWTLIAAAVRMLDQAPQFKYFRFSCHSGLSRDSDTCQRAISQDSNIVPKIPPHSDINRGENHNLCGACSTKWPDVWVVRTLSISPMVVRRKEWITYHEDSATRNIETGSAMESYNYGHPESPGPGLAGFVDGSTTAFAHKLEVARHPSRLFAYPYIHTGIQFSMWMTSQFAPTLCPFMEEHKIQVAGKMNCKKDLNAKPYPCLCDHPVKCGDKRKYFYYENQPNPWEDGCVSWRADGKPQFDAVSLRKKVVKASLAASSFWGTFTSAVDESSDFPGDFLRDLFLGLNRKLSCCLKFAIAVCVM